jgi:transcriptional regulator with XRE-family HTH domain
MIVTVRRMPIYYSALHKLLDDYGVHTIRDLCRATGLKSQQGWNLWHGKVGVGMATAKKLHEAFDIPYEKLSELPSVPKPQPKTKRGPRRKSPESGAGA